MASCRKHLSQLQNKHDGSHHAAGSPTVGQGTAGRGGGEGKTCRSAPRAGALSLPTHARTHTHARRVPIPLVHQQVSQSRSQTHLPVPSLFLSLYRRGH